MRHGRAWIICLLIVVAPATTWAQLAKGLAALERADFPAATAAFEAELTSRSASRASLAQAHRHLAMLRHVGGDVHRAHMHARIALALDGTMQPPAAAGSRVVALFQAVRGEGDVRSLGLSVRLLTRRNESSRRRLAQADVVGAPRGLPLNVHLACQVGALQLGPKVAMVARPRQSVSLALPFHTKDKTHCRCRLQTGAGAVIATQEVQALATKPAGPPQLSPSPRRESGSSPWLWIAVGTGAAATAAAIVVTILLASSPDQAQLGPVEIVGP